MVELADTLGSGSSGGSLVGVRVPPSAPDDKKRRNPNRLRLLLFVVVADRLRMVVSRGC